MAWWEGYVSDDVMGMIAPVVLAVRGTVPHDATTGALQFSFRAETGGAELGQDSAGSERRSAGARGSSSGKLPRLCRSRTSDGCNAGDGHLELFHSSPHTSQQVFIKAYSLAAPPSSGTICFWCPLQSPLGRSLWKCHWACPPFWLLE